MKNDLSHPILTMAFYPLDAVTLFRNTRSLEIERENKKMKNSKSFHRINYYINYSDFRSV